MKLGKFLLGGNFLKEKETKQLGRYYTWRDKGSSDTWDTVYPDGFSRVRDNNGEIQLESGTSLPEITVKGTDYKKHFMDRYGNEPLYEDLVRYTHNLERSAKKELYNLIIAKNPKLKGSSTYNSLETPAMLGATINRFNTINDASRNLKLLTRGSYLVNGLGAMVDKDNEHRPNMNPITNKAFNTTTVGGAVAEMAHPIQLDYGVNNSVSTFLHDLIFLEDSDDRNNGRYGHKDALEHETHAIFEPVLLKYLGNPQFADEIDRSEGGLKGYLSRVPKLYRDKY